MAASLRNTCVVSGDSMRCWGANPDGQIGDGTWGTTRSAPTPVMLSISTARSIGLGEENHACASSGSALECWGNNAFGQLGLDTTTTREPTPVPVTLLPAGAIDDLSLGRQHTCAIVAGALYCWGFNGSGQLGLGDETDRHQPTRVALPEMAVRVDAHSDHTCVLLASGAIACFGANGNRQVGSGTGSVPTPSLVPTLTGAIDIAAGGIHTCALHDDGTVSCWGSDAYGQSGQGGGFGDPDVLVPTPTSPIPERVIQITAGSRHVCALTRSGDVYCWGDNFANQAGQDQSLVDNVFVPTRVLGLANVEEIAAGGEHTCARTSAGEHLCFGSNASGELGDGTMSESWMPVSVVGL
jgi:alpha-tubulin suppressor-like RCC1 family protein